jgi:hypothetical protein
VLGEEGKKEYLTFVNFINTCVRGRRKKGVFNFCKLHKHMCSVKEHNNGFSKWSFVHSQ